MFGRSFTWHDDKDAPRVAVVNKEFAGSIFGSAIGGALLGLGWQFGGILAMLAIPATLAGLAVLLAQRVQAREVTPEPSTAH